MATVGACCRSGGPAGVPRNRAGAHRDADRVSGKSRALDMKTVIVCGVGGLLSRWHGAPIATVLVLTVVTSCSSSPTQTAEGSRNAASPSAIGRTAAPPCPTAPLAVVVSVDQWGDIVSELGGACANVKTVLASSSVDPHDYEPSPADAADFMNAKLIVVNGAGYDSWASKLAGSSASGAPLVSAAAVTTTPDGANPHLWYLPSAVTAVADAVTQELSRMEPPAAGYFSQRRAQFTSATRLYVNLIAKIKAEAAGKSYGATETVFDYQAQAACLVNKTPAGYRRASANESEPSPGDVDAFLTALAGRHIDLLIYNTQTEGSIPEEIRSAAEQSSVPVVKITETVPPGETSFEDWQYGQLVQLAKALHVAV
ncbi:ABC transporter substrate-binding protein [Mycobacterium avium subsp. paratuberculosis 10-4404]|nr:ABC transporter substrate-binding protein [Mycobacterium avium subsp. paratuberculosis 10-4404]ETB27107.1 ABC transporter substrate-binding protein [Mycobacterium avium subsp. paratuberculosis 10-5975]